MGCISISHCALRDFIKVWKKSIIDGVCRYKLKENVIKNKVKGYSDNYTLSLLISLYILSNSFEN